MHTYIDVGIIRRLVVRCGSLCCEGMCSEARRIVVPLQWAHDIDLKVAVCVFTIHS